MHPPCALVGGICGQFVCFFDKPPSTICVVSFPWLIAKCLRAIVAVVFESYPAEVTDRGECCLVSWRDGVAVSSLPDAAVFDQSM